MKRTLLVLPASKGLVVPLKDVPSIAPRKVRRILPGLLDAQVPLDLSECVHAFARNGSGYVGFVVRRADVDAVFADASADGAVLLPWALWRQCLREFPPAAETEARAALFAADGAVTIATGRGATYGAAAEVPANAEAVLRTLRMAFGAEGGAVRCLCAGEGADGWAKMLRECGACGDAVVADAPEAFRARALLGASRDLADGGVFDSPRAERRRETRLAGWRIALAVVLFGLSAAMLRWSGEADREAREASRDLTRELAHRVDALVGYPVSARGERAVALAKDAAAGRDRAPLRTMLLAGASRTLADTMEALASATTASLYAVRLDADGVALSGNAPDEAAARAFAAEMERRGYTAPIEVVKDPEGKGVVRFTMTAGRAKP